MNIFEYKDFFTPFFYCFDNIYSFNQEDVIHNSISFSDLTPLYNNKFKNEFFNFIEKNSFNFDNLIIFLNDYQENYYHIFPNAIERWINLSEFQNYWIKYFDIDDLVNSYQECYNKALQHYLNIQIETF